MHPNWRTIDDLTDRQRDIVRRICQGKRNAEIGLDLGISRQTVKNHITAILARTGSADRARLAYLFAGWEQIQRSMPVDSQVEAMIDLNVTLTFRVFSHERLFIRVGRREGLSDLFELSSVSSQELRSLLLANISADSSGEVAVPAFAELESAPATDPVSVK